MKHVYEYDYETPTLSVQQFLEIKFPKNHLDNGYAEAGTPP